MALYVRIETVGLGIETAPTFLEGAGGFDAAMFVMPAARAFSPSGIVVDPPWVTVGAELSAGELAFLVALPAGLSAPPLDVGPAAEPPWTEALGLP